jgi:hypothetical protein
MNASITQRENHCDIRVSDSQDNTIIAAHTTSSSRLKSELFNSVDEFVTFIKGGLSSYTASTHLGKMSRVDLMEDSNTYRPIDAKIDCASLSDQWKDSRIEFDSAFHATGGLYRLAFLGTIPVQQRAEKMQESAKVWPQVLAK